MAAMTSSFDEIASNSWEHVLTCVRLFLENFVEIRPVVLPKQLWTHTQTHRHTHTDAQTPPDFPPDTITIHLVNEMTKCKKIRFMVLQMFQKG